MPVVVPAPSPLGDARRFVLGLPPEPPALLEADVNFKVVKQLIENVKQKAMGEEVLTSLSPSQQIVGIINQEL
jgi:SRP54 family protein